jgi:hypothetical protein
MAAYRTQEEDIRIFPTRVDCWLGFVAAFYVLVALGFPAWHLGSAVGASHPVDYVVIVFPLAVLAVIGMVSYPCEYILEPKHLVVRSGMLRNRIPLLAITAVHPSRSLASAPAWSLDRLEIRYGRTQHVVISPKAKSDFLDELQSRAPHLVRAGDGLVVAEAWKTAEERNR